MKSKNLFILSVSLLLITSCSFGQGNNSISSSSQVSSSNQETSSDTSNSSEDSTISSSEDSTTSSSEDTTISSSEDSNSNSSSSDSSIPNIQNHVINVVKNGSDGSLIDTNSTFETTSSFSCSEATKVYYAGDNEYAVKLASGSGAGILKFTTTIPMSIKTMTINAKYYNNDAGAKLSVELSNGEILSNAITTSDYSEYTYSFSGNQTITSFTITANKGKRVLLNSISFSSTSSSTGGSSSSSDSSNSSSSNSSSSIIIPSDSDIANPENDPYKGNYYSSISTTSTGDALVKELGSLISSTHKAKTYDDLKNGYKYTDLKPGTNYIWDIYSNYNYTWTGTLQSSYPKEGAGYNREHIIPQSWFSKQSPMVSDIIQVLPTDGYVNNQRGNYPFGEVITPTYTSENGSKLGKDKNGVTVFEPIDEYKGDIARIYFYMGTRYYSQVGSWSGGVFQSTYPYIKSNYFDLYYRWAIEDPVSEKEILRNEGCYTFQNNRNPYVDCPSMFYRAFGIL